MEGNSIEVLDGGQQTLEKKCSFSNISSVRRLPRSLIKSIPIIDRAHGLESNLDKVVAV